MNNILVTGSKGQLGSELQAIYQEYDYTFFFTSKEELDISSKDSIEAFINVNAIDTIINAAAYTAVDKAEENQIQAQLINTQAIQTLAEIAQEKNIKLIHISTDYVFDGTASQPYSEHDSTHPIGIYGQSKLDGENAMIRINPKNSIIIRTSWVYSSYGANFVKTMLKLAKHKDSLSVIFDQIGTPTYAKDLARAILSILPQLENNKVAIYNYSNEGVLSWYDFAKDIMQITNLSCVINPIESKDYPTPVKRPHYSLLNKAKIKKEFNLSIPYYKDSLKECLQLMGEIN